MSDLLTVAANMARAEFTPPRYQPNVWAGKEGNADLARMSRVALLDIPALTARFEVELEVWIARIRNIDRAPVRLRVIDGGQA